MLDLGLDEFGKKIIKQEKWLWDHFGSGTKYHDLVAGGLFLALGIKIYIQGDLKALFSSINKQKQALGRTILLVCVLLVIFQKDETINLTVQHAIFGVFFHIMTHTHNIANIFWFSLITMYYFNSTAAEE